MKFYQLGIFLLFVTLSLSQEVLKVSRNDDNHLSGSFNWDSPFSDDHHLFGSLNLDSPLSIKTVQELVFDFNSGVDAKGSYFAFFSSDGSVKLRLEERFRTFNVTFVQLGEVKRWYVTNGHMMMVMDHDPNGPLDSLPRQIIYANQKEEFPENELLRVFITKYGHALVDLSLNLASKGLHTTSATRTLHFMAMKVAKTLEAAELLGIDKKFDHLFKKSGECTEGTECPAVSELNACKSPYNKCGNKCYGRCGPDCTCWHWVCDDCQCHGGCEYHDWCCSCVGMWNPYCLNPTVAYAIGGGCRCC